MSERMSFLYIKSLLLKQNRDFMLTKMQSMNRDHIKLGRHIRGGVNTGQSTKHVENGAVSSCQSQIYIVIEYSVWIKAEPPHEARKILGN